MLEDKNQANFVLASGEGSQPFLDSSSAKVNTQKVNSQQATHHGSRQLTIEQLKTPSHQTAGVQLIKEMFLPAGYPHSVSEGEHSSG
jgi:hypothetical protein